MEVSIEQMIDIGLNVIGYIAGGAFWLVIYSAWQNRRARRTAAEPAGTDANVKERQATPAGAQPAVAGAGDIQFLDLRRGPDTQRKRLPVSGGDDESVSKRRSHAEVFATARKMMEKGATADTIKSVLPISDGELALIASRK
jgi:hypothetical protein